MWTWHIDPAASGTRIRAISDVGDDAAAYMDGRWYVRTRTMSAEGKAADLAGALRLIRRFARQGGTT
jgi:hypothetical protein